MTEDFKINNGVLEEYIGDSRGVVIPESVKIISNNAFKGNRYLNSVDMSNSNVMQIGSSAFLDCTNLVSVKTSQNLTSIDSHAFRGCAALTKIYLPQSINSIGICAFSQCTALEEVHIGMNANERRSRSGVAVDGEFVYSGGAPLNIGDYAFSGCSELLKINLTARLNKLGERAFEGCKKLTEIIVYLEDGTYVANNAFIGCNNVVIKYRGDKKSKDWWKSKFAENAKIKIKYNF